MEDARGAGSDPFRVDQIVSRRFSAHRRLSFTGSCSSNGSESLARFQDLQRYVIPASQPVPRDPVFQL